MTSPRSPDAGNAMYCTCFGSPCPSCQRIAEDLESEADRVKAKLAWFTEREPFVRALVGAVEDAGVFRDEAQDEWRMLVDWEMENRS